MLICNLNKGFDITDEAFYILNATYPMRYINGVSSFAVCTNILYDLANRDIVLFRALGVLILLFSAVFASWQYVVYLEMGGGKKSSLFKDRFLVISVATYSSLSYYFKNWLTTPSYNWLQLVGSIVVFGAVFYFLNISLLKRVLFASFLAGIGVFLILCGNPLAAILIACVVFLMISVSQIPIRLKTIMIAASIFWSLLFFIINIHINYINIVNFIDIVLGEMELSKTLGAGHSFYEAFYRFKQAILTLINPIVFYVNTKITLVFLLLITSFFISERKKGFTFRYTNFFLNISPILIVLIYCFTEYRNEYTYGLNTIYLLINLFFIFIIRRFLLDKKMVFSIAIDFSKIFPLIILFPLLMRFGTNNELISASFAGMYYYSLMILSFGVFIYTNFEDYHFKYTFFLVLSILIFSIQLKAYRAPYRLNAPIGEQVYKISPLNNHTELYLEKKTYEWAIKLQEAAIENNWCVGDSIIDLTGGSPGVAVILGGVLPGVAWLSGGYKGSDAYALKVLSNIDERVLKQSWILLSPKGKLRISPGVLKKLNINLDEYRRVVSVRSGYRNELQELWRPLINSR